MTIVKEVTVEGIRYPVTVSDDNEALLAAAAAGSALTRSAAASLRPFGGGVLACPPFVFEMEVAGATLFDKASRRQ